MTTALDRPARRTSGRKTVDRPASGRSASNPQQPQNVTVTGVLDVDATGKGYLRGAGLVAGSSDPVVSAALVRRHGLRKGDLVEGVLGDRRALTDIARVDGRTPTSIADRPHFRDLTPVHPTAGSAWNTGRPGSPAGSSICWRRWARGSADCWSRRPRPARPSSSSSSPRPSRGTTPSAG